MREPLKHFLAETAGLGDRLAVLLVQLPPSFAFGPRPVRAFFSLLAERCEAAVVCKPRHASWFTPSADRVLAASRVSRVAADPGHWPEARRSGGRLGPAGDGRGAVLYHRWPGDADRWCIFDDTAAGHAVSNALELRALRQDD